MNTKSLLSATVVMLSFAFSACNTTDNDNPIIASPTTQFTATLNGQQEKPTSTTSTATGTFAGNLNESTRVMSYTVTFTGLTPTMGHLHRITKSDGTGGVDVPFTGTLTSPYSNTVLLAQSKIDSMKNGFYYANLHTTAYPAGEIRGDIKKQ
ncbi:CHRD domain-containing protein [Spirosoma knui]